MPIDVKNQKGVAHTQATMFSQSVSMSLRTYEFSDLRYEFTDLSMSLRT